MPIFENLDLLFNSFQPSTAKIKQFRPPFVAFKQSVQWQLAGLHGLNQAVELTERVFVTGRRQCLWGVGGSLGHCGRVKPVIVVSHLRTDPPYKTAQK